MLETFKHKGLEVFFTEDDRRLLSPRHVGRIKRILDLLNDAAKVEELNIPGYELHPPEGRPQERMEHEGIGQLANCLLLRGRQRL